MDKISRRTMLLCVSLTVILSGCGLSNDANSRLTSLCNSACSRQYGVSSSGLVVEYSKNRFLQTEYTKVTGTVTYSDSTETLDVLSDRTLKLVTTVLKSSGIDSGDFDFIATMSGNEKRITSKFSGT